MMLLFIIGALSLEMKYFQPDMILKSVIASMSTQIESKHIRLLVQIHKNVPLQIYGKQYESILHIRYYCI